jgi:multiple sugar transport system substrate-binding protein
LAACGQTEAPAAPAPSPDATPSAPAPTAVPDATQPAATPAAPATLRVHARAGVEDEMFGKMLPQFEAANPGVTVTLEEFPSVEYLQKVQTLAAGGQLGDVLQLFTNDASYQLFFAGGSLAAIDDYIRQDNVDLSEWYAYSIDACRVDGRMGGLPFKAHPSRVGLFYNVDLFEQARIDPPTLDWTYDQLADTASRINDPPAAYGFSHPWRDISYYSIMSRMYGGDFFAADGRSTQIDLAESRQGWTWHYEMMNQRRVTANPIQTAPTPNDLFVSGQLAMLRSNVGAKAGFTGITNFRWNMTLAPKGPTGNRGSLAETDVGR